MTSRRGPNSRKLHQPVNFPNKLAAALKKLGLTEDEIQTIKRGRSERVAKFEPTQEQRAKVETLAGLGLSKSEIGMVMDISESTIDRYFLAEFRRGLVVMDAKVMQRLALDAMTPGHQFVAARIFWAKTRRKMHEIQRVIHGFDPDVVGGFVRQVVSLLRRELPETCPHCQTNLGLPKKIAGKLRELSNALADKLQPSEIVPIETPAIDHQRGEAPADGQGKG